MYPAPENQLNSLRPHCRSHQSSGHTGCLDNQDLLEAITNLSWTHVEKRPCDSCLCLNKVWVSNVKCCFVQIPCYFVEKHFFQKPSLLSELQTPDTEACPTQLASPLGSSCVPSPGRELEGGHLRCPETLNQATKMAELCFRGPHTQPSSI